MSQPDIPEDLWRDLAPRVLGALVRRYGHFDLAEDAVQDALLAASRQWPAEGIPDNPFGWTLTVAGRRLTDRLRSERARMAREERAGTSWLVESRGREGILAADDTLLLLVMCCHPCLPQASQIALTLRAVAGLTTPQIARAFLVSPETLTRRITRAKTTLRAEGATFALPTPRDIDERLDSVLHVVYLLFTEGYAATSGPQVMRAELCAEAIRLGRRLHAARPGDAEVAGLLALMLVTDARRPARSTPAGEPVTLDRQDRTLWDQDAIAEGTALLRSALRAGELGRYQLLAVIGAVHSEAASTEATDWSQILACYRLLRQIDPSPMAALNETVAIAHVEGFAAALAALDRLPELRSHYRAHAVRAFVLEGLGDTERAARSYADAADAAGPLPIKRHLRAQADRLRPHR